MDRRATEAILDTTLGFGEDKSIVMIAESQARSEAGGLGHPITAPSDTDTVLLGTPVSVAGEVLLKNRIFEGGEA